MSIHIVIEQTLVFKLVKQSKQIEIVKKENMKFIFSRQKTVVFSFVILLGGAGCAPKYIPEVINTPMLKNKGEMQVSASGGSSKFSPKISYAITNNIAIMASGVYADQEKTEEKELLKIKYGEVGAGYYNRFGKYGVFDVYGGYGCGTIKSSYTGWEVEEWNTYEDLINNRFFLQPSIGYTSKIVDANFATKFSLTSIHDNEIYRTRLFITPVATIKVGYDYIKFIFQAGAAFRTGQKYTEFDYNPFVINFGVQLGLFGRWDEKKTE